MAHLFAQQNRDAIFSYAGRTDNPKPQPLPTRFGGFGGTIGLVNYLKMHKITHVIDATHPFAAQMSKNTTKACSQTGVELCALERGCWMPEPADNWTNVPDIQAAVTAIPAEKCNIFLAIGKQNLDVFAERPNHHYLVRLVDKPKFTLPFPSCSIVISKGPFSHTEDEKLLQKHAINLIIAKNSGGTGARAKLDAARNIGIKVIMIDRPYIPHRLTFTKVKNVIDWLDHTQKNVHV